MAAYLSAVRPAHLQHFFSINNRTVMAFYSLLYYGLPLSTLLIMGVIHFIDGDGLMVSRATDTKVCPSQPIVEDTFPAAAPGRDVKSPPA